MAAGAPLFDRNADDASSHHAERACCAERQIDDPSTDEGPAIIDATMNGVAVVAHAYDAAEGPRAVRASHAMAAAAIIGSQTAFGLS